MRAIWIVFTKELRDTLRDRRTLIAMVVVPLLLFPVLFLGAAWLAKSQAEKASEKTLEVAAVGPSTAFGRSFADVAAAANVHLVTDLPPDSARARVERGILDAALVFPPTFAATVEDQRPGRVQFLYKSGGGFDIPKRRLTRLVEAYERELLAARFDALGLRPSAAEAVALDEVDLASAQEQVAKLLGGIVPYIFLLFCFSGCMYPAIDLGAGEKERGTLETLLTTPVPRVHLLAGKCAAITLAGVLSAVMAFASVALSARFIGDLPGPLADAIGDLLAPGVVVTLLAMLIPLTLFFAATQLSLSFFAGSFKEAQSTISPMLIVVIVLAAIGLIPGVVSLNVGTALVPVLNVSLATKEVIAGTASVGLLALVYASLLALAGASLVVAARLFRRETIIFRS